MAPSKLDPLRHGTQPQRAGVHRGPGRWSTGLIALLVAAGAGIGLVVGVTQTRSPERLGSAASVASGNERFSRAASRCHLTASAARRRRQPSLLLGLSASLRLVAGRGRCEEARLVQATAVEAVREDLPGGAGGAAAVT